MRIKQSKLGKPEYQYSRVVNGVEAVVSLHREPCLCVNIETVDKDGIIVRHCYPLSDAEYSRYCLEAINWYSPDKELFKLLAQDYRKLEAEQQDPSIKRFYHNVACCYEKRSR